jgi:hypothetical protein
MARSLLEAERNQNCRWYRLRKLVKLANRGNPAAA